MKTTLFGILVLSAVCSSASAGEKCTDAPRTSWLSTNDVTTKLAQQGLRVQKIEVDDGCYEVHATRSNGDQIELKLHPINATVIEQDIRYAQPAAPTSAGPVAPVLR